MVTKEEDSLLFLPLGDLWDYDIRLGYADYSEYFIGHSGSIYWCKKDSEKTKIFRNIEPYLTFLNVRQLQRQDADIRTKVEEVEELNKLNQLLRERESKRWCNSAIVRSTHGYNRKVAGTGEKTNNSISTLL